MDPRDNETPARNPVLRQLPDDVAKLAACGRRMTDKGVELARENAALRAALALVQEAEDERRAMRQALPWAALLLVAVAGAFVAAWALVLGRPVGTVELMTGAAIGLAGVAVGMAQEG